MKKYLLIGGVMASWLVRSTVIRAGWVRVLADDTVFRFVNDRYHFRYLDNF